MRLHHVQVACPPDGEEEVRRFYGRGLGLPEAAKPEALVARGGCWFRHPGGAEIHVGVEEPFTPARKAHPALVVDSVAELDATGELLASMGYVVDHSERDTFPGYVRLHTYDGHGNRVELLAPRD